MNLIKNKALKSINNFRKILNENGFDCNEISEKKFNYEMNIKANGRNFKLLVYFGKKGVKNVIQGNTSLPEYYRIKEIVEENYDLFHKIDNFDEPEEYIGTDETGKGDIFGPIVVAAVYVNKSTKEKLKILGVRDSKNLSAAEIKRLSKEIIKIVDNKISIIKLNPAEYNRMYAEFKNLNKMLEQLHLQAITGLLRKVKCGFVITDKFQKKELFINAHNEFTNVKFVQEHKAEKYVGVAAASVLARAEIIKWFEEVKISGEVIPKGASQKAEEFLKRILGKLSNEELFKLVKLNFKSLKKFGRNI